MVEGHPPYRVIWRVDLYQGDSGCRALGSRQKGKETDMVSEEDRLGQLQSRLAALKARLAGIETELESHQARDWEDLATEREGDEVLEGIGLSGKQEIQMIEAAMARIGSGDYGACTRCGEAIAEERLNVLPFTPFCSTCAAQVGGRHHG